MEEHDAGQVEETFDRVIEVVAQIHLATLPATERHELAEIGGQLEALGRTISALAAARLPETTPEAHEPDQRSHPLHGVET